MKKLLSCALLCLASAGYADNFVVQNGETVNTTQTLTDPGDQGLIEEEGVIATAAGPGVIMLAANQTVLNKGTITTTGAGANGDGINNVGNANAVITNSGIIATQGTNSHGIFNSGGANALITNSGTITTLGLTAFGIANTGANALITNRGAISTLGETAYGIYNAGADALITNSGTISTLGETAHGIRSIGANVHIINSGTIHSAQGDALQLTNVNPTLTLLRGSILQGPVNVTQPLNLNVETGLNLALVLNPGQTFNALGIDAPFVRVGNTVVVIDPTGLASQADILADLSDTILGGIYRNRIGFPCCCNNACGLWVQALGSYRERNAQESIVGYHNWQGGFLVGYTMPALCGDIGLFGGAAFGQAVVDQTTQKNDISNYFAGLSYEHLFCNSFVGAALVMGYTHFDNDRYVMYNLAPNGVQKAHSKTRGFFISPELTYAQQLPIWCYKPTLSTIVRYAGLFLGDYSEEGSIANLSVKDRDIHLLTLRGELGLPFSSSSCGWCWSVEPYAGVIGRFQVAGKRVDAELFGQDLSFDPGGPRNLAAFLVGARGTQQLGCLDFFLNIEASFDHYKSSRILAEGGVGFAF